MIKTKFEDLLNQFKKKTITKAELEKLFSSFGDENLYFAIEPLVNAGMLVPITSSGTNGNRLFPIQMRYRIILPTDIYTELLSEIEILHPLLQENGYLRSNPAVFEKYRNAFQLLDRYLFSKPSLMDAISRKERSFEIFEDEKFLDNSSFCKHLDKIGLTKDVLLYYDTPEYCFNDYIPLKKDRLTLLICENKDIWFNLRRMMFENGASELLGVHVDGVICGWGNKVTKTLALTSYTNFLGCTDVSYLYWGDIDRAGFNIYLGLLRNNPQLCIRLFVPGYEKMLELSLHKTNIPDSDDQREIIGDFSGIYTLFPDRLRSLLEDYILKNKRVPQEIIPYTRLQNIMR